MPLSSHPDFYHQLISSRFPESNLDRQSPSPIGDDFYIDLLCVFHEPDRFDAKDFLSYPIPAILTYLKQTHILYTTKTLDEISASIQGLAKADKKFQKLERSLSHFFEGFRVHLEEHIEEEEKHLFPYVEELIVSSKGKVMHSKHAKNRLVDFLLHHDDSQEKDLERLAKALAGSSFFNDSFAFRMLVNRLSLFELDLKIHARIEEEVFMPLALKLEQDVSGD